MFYPNKFESYVSEFANLHQLFDKDQKNLLALSGGVDSMALAYVLLAIDGIKFEVIHFNHGTRLENKVEQKFVEDFCKAHGLICHVYQLFLDSRSANFEHTARLERKNIYRQFIKRGHTIILGHHLDDSFEWSLMQKFRQGNASQTLGIPLKGQGLIRPFMCVSKNQIINYAKAKNILWHEDLSNHNLKYERNFIRHELVLKIKERYPQYLKHYVYQANANAYLHGVHRLLKLKKENPLKMSNHFLSGIVLSSNYLDLYRHEILNQVIKLSHAERGKVNVVIDQIFSTIKKMRADEKYLKFHGPYAFSGGVWAFLFKDRLFITQRTTMDLFEQLDRELCQSLPQGKTHIPYPWLNNSQLKYFPNLFIQSKLNQISKPSKLNLPFYPQTLTYLKQSDIPYSFVWPISHS